MFIPTLAYRQEVILTIPQTWEYPPPVYTPSHSHYFMMSMTSSRAAVQERHDLRASAVRKEHHHLRTAPTGRKPIGPNPRDLTYRLSSRLLRSRPPRARSRSRSLSDLLRSSRLRSRSRSSESSPRRSRTLSLLRSRSSSRRGRYLRLLDSRECLVSRVLTDLREGVRETSESRRVRPRREFATIWLRTSSAEAFSPFLMKSLTCLFSTLSGDMARNASTTESSGSARNCPIQLAAARSADCSLTSLQASSPSSWRLSKALPRPLPKTYTKRGVKIIATCFSRCRTWPAVDII